MAFFAKFQSESARDKLMRDLRLSHPEAASLVRLSVIDTRLAVVNADDPLLPSLRVLFEKGGANVFDDIQFEALGSELDAASIKVERS